jgi:hypothetical protein
MWKIIVSLRAILLLTAVAMFGSGCALSAIVYKVMGPPPIPPKYYVPPNDPLLVLVENAHSGSSAIPEAEGLARVISEDLAEHKVAPMIEPTKVNALRDGNPQAFAKMTIAQVGRALGAKQVLYVHVDQLDINSTDASQVVRLKIALKLKMVNVATATTVWPKSGDTEPYDFETPMQRVLPGTSQSGLNHQILRESGVEIARWFYAYQPETMSEENRDERLR